MKLTLLERMLITTETFGTKAIQTFVPGFTLTIPVTNAQAQKTAPYFKRFLELMGGSINNDIGLYEATAELIKEAGIGTLKALPDMVQDLEILEPLMNELFEKMSLDDAPHGQAYIRHTLYKDNIFDYHKNILTALDTIERMEPLLQSALKNLKIRKDLDFFEPQLRKLFFANDYTEIEAMTKTGLRFIRNGRISKNQLSDPEKTARANEKIKKEISLEEEKRNKKSKKQTKQEKPPPTDLQTKTTMDIATILKQGTSPAKKERAPQLKSILSTIKERQIKAAMLLDAEEHTTKITIKRYEELNNTLNTLTLEMTETEQDVKKLFAKNKRLRKAARKENINLDGIETIKNTRIQERTHTNSAPEYTMEIPKVIEQTEIDAAEGSDKRRRKTIYENQNLKHLCHALQSIVRENSNRAHTDLELEYKKTDVERRLKTLNERQRALTIQNAKIEALQNGHTSQADFENATYPHLSKIKNWTEVKIPSGHIIILDKAFKGAANSNYLKPELIFQTIELLANEYRNQMLSGTLSEEARKDTRKAFIDKKESLSLDRLGDSFQASSSGKYAEHYYATYNGKKYLLDKHIGRGNSSDPRLCLRIYFTWIAEEKAVLIGHMPTHLVNNIS